MSYLNRQLLALCLAWLVLACAVPAHAATGFDELLARHQRAMQPLAELFAMQPVRIEYIEGNPADKKSITHLWQDGKYRSEFHWLGFTEVFAFDGQDNWYGSDINLPYTLDQGAGMDLTPELVEAYAYLRQDQLQYLGPGGAVPLSLDNKYATIRYTPPGMSEALLLLDPFDFRLAGMLQSTDHRLDDASLYRLTTYEDWSDFGACRYPAVTRLQTLTPKGELVRERYQTAQSVQVVAPQPAGYFQRSAAPVVPSPQLPTVPYVVPFSYLNDTVVVKCTGPDGKSYKFELDTGANVGLLRRDVVRRLGLTPTGDEEVTGHGGRAQVGYVRVEGIKLGGAVTLPPWPAAVLSGDQGLDESLSGNGVSGLLGTFVLNNFVVQLDYRRRRMLLWPPGQFDPQRDLNPGYYSIPCVRDSMPYVMVDVDNKIQGGAFFNTGAQQYFTLSAWALDRAGLSYDVESFSTGVTIHGKSAFAVIRPAKVRLGQLVLENPATHLELLAPGEAPNPHRIASFGNAFFQRYKVTFDLFSQFYYIESM
jgi:hypothetical protein